MTPPPAGERAWTGPLMPLPHMVLLPGERLTLLVFAPRYRQLVADALSDGGAFAVSAIVREDLTEPPRHPRVAPVGCVANIVASRKLPSGELTVDVEGGRRLRIAEESLGGGDYRTVSGSLMVDVVAGDAMTVRELRLAIGRRVPPGDEDEPELEELSDRDFVTAAATRLDLDQDARQALLDEDSLIGRLLLLRGRVWDGRGD